MPLKPGYSRATIQANIEQMIREKHPRNNAIAAAHDSARKSYWKKHPQGFLPSWIYPPKDGKRMKNPVPLSKKAKVNQAAKLYEEFSGHDADEVLSVDKPDIPDVMLVVGQIDGVMYSTVRDGVAEKYIHKFKKSCRPIFAVSHDGKQLFMLGGAYDFTERGIIDNSTGE